MATQMTVPNSLDDEYISDIFLLRRSGYSLMSPVPTVIVTRLGDSKSRYCYHDWNDRTMEVAHKYIEKNFSILQSGQVIDVEFILGETKFPKISERLEEY